MNPLSKYRKLIINALLISCISALFFMMVADMPALNEKQRYYTYSRSEKNNRTELNVVEMIRMKFLMLREW